jgi:opacity protein-like surface antigen
MNKIQFVVLLRNLRVLFILIISIIFIIGISNAAKSDNYYNSPHSLSGFYIGGLGQYNYADAKFTWDGDVILDQASHNWGVSGVMGYGWRWGSFYLGPEAYFSYANISNVLAETVDPVTALSIDREYGAGINLLIGFTGFEEQMLFYGLVGGGATDFSGNIVAGGESLKGSIWYPVLSLGAGMDWSVSDSVAVRIQGKHTFYYDASEQIFSSDTKNSYDLDTTTFSIGFIWRPWN